VHIAAANAEIAEQRSAEFTDIVVVVARHIDDLRAFLCHRQDRAHHLVVVFGPIERAAQTPEIDDVADEK
jgi:hypothetical protein